MARKQKFVMFPSGGGCDLSHVVAWSSAVDASGKRTEGLVVFFDNTQSLQIPNGPDERALRVELVRQAKEIEDPYPFAAPERPAPTVAFPEAPPAEEAPPPQE